MISYETPEKTVNSDLERKVEELNKKLEEAEKKGPDGFP